MKNKERKGKGQEERKKRKGKVRKGTGRKGKERKGKERKGKERDRKKREKTVKKTKYYERTKERNSVCVCSSFSVAIQPTDSIVGSNKSNTNSCAVCE